MANLNDQFKKFHEKIRLSDDDGKAKLREKRDLLVSTLKSGLKKREEDGKEKLTFESFNQGGNAMHTAVVPLDGEYDIDVGVIFDNEKGDFDNPVQLKKIVKSSIESNFRKVRIRRPCVTVTYIKDGKPEYHVDLAIYVKKPYSSDLELAIGREYSSEDQMEWLSTNPKSLIDKINNRFSDEDRKQFKRTIRYLKRWRDKRFSNSNEAPISIGLTCAAYEWFSPKKMDGEYNDLRALKELVQSMLNNFSLFTDRLIVKLPVTPFNDLFEGLTDKQMKVFKDKLEALRDSLTSALEEDSKEAACKILVKEFGDEFPVPDADKSKASNNAKKSYVSPVVTTGTSA